MCGIVGYIGSAKATPVLLAGIAVIEPGGKIAVRKAKGKLENLRELLSERPVSGCVGSGHTRWATHGEPSDLNAHPHTDV